MPVLRCRCKKSCCEGARPHKIGVSPGRREAKARNIRVSGDWKGIAKARRRHSKSTRDKSWQAGAEQRQTLAERPVLEGTWTMAGWHSHNPSISGRQTMADALIDRLWSHHCLIPCFYTMSDRLNDWFSSKAKIQTHHYFKSRSLVYKTKI